MPDNKADYEEIKRKIRKLKKLEIKIRFPRIYFENGKQEPFVKPETAELVWDEFFDLHDACTGKTSIAEILMKKVWILCD